MRTSVGRAPARDISSDQVPARDFFLLLGLSPTADAREVRERYGLEVVRAMHAGNPTRAVALSAAFDALPVAQRQRIHTAGVAPRRTPRVPRTFSLPGTLDASLPGVLNTAALLGGAHRRGAGAAAVWSRLLLTAVAIALCVLVSHTVGTNLSHAFATFAAELSRWQHAAVPVLSSR